MICDIRYTCVQFLPKVKQHTYILKSPVLSFSRISLEVRNKTWSESALGLYSKSITVNQSDRSISIAFLERLFRRQWHTDGRVWLNMHWVWTLLCAECDPSGIRNQHYYKVQEGLYVFAWLKKISSTLHLTSSLHNIYWCIDTDPPA